MNDQTPRYSMLIEWSNLDDAYIVSFPEWERSGYLSNSHGATYAEAAQKGQEMLESLIEWAHSDHESLPEPALFDTQAYRPGETAESIARESQELLREIAAKDAASTARPNVV